MVIMTRSVRPFLRGICSSEGVLWSRGYGRIICRTWTSLIMGNCIYICNMEEIDICKNGHITSYNPQYPQILTPYHIPFDPMARYQEATKSGVGPDSLVQVAAQCNIIYIYIS